MKEVIFMNEIRLTGAVIGTAVNCWMGGFDGLLTALVGFMVVDYLTGVFAAIVEHKLSSSVGAKGILQKVLILKQQPKLHSLHSVL